MKGEINNDLISLHQYKKITEFEEIPNHVIKCSACGKPLVDIRILQQGAKINRFRASCCFCGDKSFVEEVAANKVYIGGICEFINREEFSEKTKTIVVDIEYDDDYTTVHTAKP